MLALTFFAQTSMGMAPSQRAPQISIENQQAALYPSFIGVASVFMNIQNSGKGDDNLLSAKTAIPNTIVELHEVRDGRMTRAGKIHIPPGHTVELKPGGPHIMVFKLPKNIREGDKLTMILFFEKSGEKRLDLKLSKF